MVRTQDFTEIGQWELRIDFQFANQTSSYVHYKQFKVGNSSAEYPLTIGGFTVITLEDPFLAHPINTSKFTTINNDNDQSSGNCAEKGAWWSNRCYNLNPNCLYAYIYLKNYYLLAAETKIHQYKCVDQ